MNQEFNVPLIVRYSDSFGNTLYRNQFHMKTISGLLYVSFRDVWEYYLRPGDKVSVEIEIDPTFPKNEYQIIWDPYIEGTTDNNHYSYTVQNKDVGEKFSISAKVKTNKEWHRLIGVDDGLVIGFKVLPPL